MIADDGADMGVFRMGGSRLTDWLRGRQWPPASALGHKVAENRLLPSTTPGAAHCDQS
jgi:hypothetical protein